MIITRKTNNMKSITIFFAAALMALTFSSKAGNLENCCLTAVQELNAAVSYDAVESASVSDSAVSAMIKEMTQAARAKVNADGVDAILNNMTQLVRERVRSDKPVTNL
jgi:hypothetical protein